MASEGMPLATKQPPHHDRASDVAATATYLTLNGIHDLRPVRQEQSIMLANTHSFMGGRAHSRVAKLASKGALESCAKLGAAPCGAHAPG